MRVTWTHYATPHDPLYYAELMPASIDFDNLELAYAMWADLYTNSERRLDIDDADFDHITLVHGQAGGLTIAVPITQDQLAQVDWERFAKYRRSSEAIEDAMQEADKRTEMLMEEDAEGQAEESRLRRAGL